MTPRIGITGVLRDWDGAARTGVNAAYARSVIQAGGTPFVLPPFTPPAQVADVLDGLDGLLLTGGEDVNPARYGTTPSPRLGTVSDERDAFELAMIGEARERGTPILGICRGIQIINVAFGGTLWQDLPTERPGAVEHDPGTGRSVRSHRIRLLEGSRAADVLGRAELSANSFHHQAARELGGGLIASGWADDGVIEAVEAESEESWLLAVQWHPEEMHAEATAPERGLFRALVAEAAAATGRPARGTAGRA